MVHGSMNYFEEKQSGWNCCMVQNWIWREVKPPAWYIVHICTM